MLGKHAHVIRIDVDARFKSDLFVAYGP